MVDIYQTANQIFGREVPREDVDAFFADTRAQGIPDDQAIEEVKKLQAGGFMQQYEQAQQQANQARTKEMDWGSALSAGLSIRPGSFEAAKQQNLRNQNAEADRIASQPLKDYNAQRQVINNQRSDERYALEQADQAELRNPDSISSQTARELAKQLSPNMNVDGLTAEQIYRVIPSLEKIAQNDLKRAEASRKSEATLTPYDKESQSQQAKSDVIFANDFPRQDTEYDLILNSLNKMEQLINSGNVNTGMTAGIAPDRLRNDSEKQYDLAINKLQTDVAKENKGQGSFSDGERQLFKDTLPKRDLGKDGMLQWIADQKSKISKYKQLDTDRYNGIKGGSSSSSSSSQPSQSSDGFAIVITPDGKERKVPLSRIDDALKAGGRLK